MYTPQISIPVSRIENEAWKNGAPLLSVVVPCYNYGKYIRDALESIQSQTFRDYEIIVVDDGSKDKFTLGVLNDLKREGVRVLTQEHSGPARALNSGISLARGKYVCCLSADDMIEPTYFEKSLVLLESNPGISFTYPLVKAFGREQRVGFTKPFDLALLLTYNHVCGSAVFLRDAWKVVGGFNTSMPAYEDWDFWISLGESGFRGRLIPEPLFKWRRHPQTFGMRVDQRRPHLIAKIRNNHRDLFSVPARIEAIQKNYRDRHVSNPFLNLASKKQYAQSSEPIGVILVSEPPSLPNRIYDFIANIRERRMTLISIIEGDSESLGSKVRSLSSHTYSLTHLLDPYCWKDFVVNLIGTRSAQFILICNSRLGYELSPTIKERTSCIVADVVESRAFETLRAKFDASIDYHIVPSKDSSKSFSDHPEVSRDKDIVSNTFLELFLRPVSQEQ
jgi:glycosyltransferase involved in cell wall biosynthesis